mgnify:CR=1 FL=1
MTDLEKEIVPIELASELREIGFDEYCMFYYEHGKPALRFGLESRDIKNKSHFSIMRINAHNILKLKSKKVDIAAPSYEQIFAWFRKKGLFHNITLSRYFMEDNVLFFCEVRDSNAGIITFSTSNTYEEAKIEMLKKLIEAYKNEEKEKEK